MLPSLCGNSLVTSVIGQSFLVISLSFRRTKLPVRRFAWSCVHFRLTRSNGRNSLLYRAQKTLARYCICLLRGVQVFRCELFRWWWQGRGEGFCVRSMEGHSILGASGSVDTGVRGQLFIMAGISAIKVVSTSWLSCLVDNS